MKSNKNLSELSALSGRNWSWVKLGDVCEIIMGQSPPSSTYNTEKIGLPFFQGKAEFTEFYPEVKKWCSKPKKIAEPNDILVSVRAPVGSTNIANQKCCIGRGLASLRYPDCNRFIFYYFRLIENKLDELGTGTTFKAISSKTLNNLEIPLPPLPEQKKIVEKIEELFSSLDSGVASLKKAKEQIRLYRQSVLAFAFSGKLTTKNTKDTKKLSELSALSGSLPPGWKWVKLGEVCESINPGFPSGQHNRENIGIPHIRPMNINFYGKIDLSNVKYVHVKEYKKLDKGDILFNNTNSPELLGKTTIIPENTNWAYSNHMTRIKVNREIISSKFVAYFLHHLFWSGYFKINCVNHVNQSSINKDFLQRKVMLPLPSLTKQTQIVSEIEKRFSEVDNLEKAIDESLTKAETLRQSILKHAFEGKLV